MLTQYGNMAQHYQEVGPLHFPLFFFYWQMNIKLFLYQQGV